MIELVFIACLAAQPATCEERALTFVDTPGVMDCLFTAQPRLARWSESHPDWRIARWRCGPAGARGVRI